MDGGGGTVAMVARHGGKTTQSFSFPFFITKNMSESGIVDTGAETGYNGYRNGRKSENLPECIII